MANIHLLISKRFRPLLAFLLAVPVACSMAGCSLYFDHRYHGENFVLYSDHQPDFIARTGTEVEQIFSGYTRLFKTPGDEIGDTTIVLQGEPPDETVVDLSYSPQLLGYYLPIFNLISVDTTASWTREPETLRQILLHEVAHHFIITDYPEASDRCWLNEGLAGNLEMTLFDGETFEYPLINPPLLRIARRTISNLQYEFSLREFVDTSWNEFHQDGKKEIHYALAWSVINFLLTKHLDASLPLGHRIKQLYHLSSDRIGALEPEWRRHLHSFDLTKTLIELAYGGSPNLTSSWAIRQLGSNEGLDRPTVLAALESGFSSPGDARRQSSYLSFLRTIGRSFRTSYPNVEESRLIQTGISRVQEILEESAISDQFREILMTEITRSVTDQWLWIPTLVDLLESTKSNLRAMAAHGLAQTHIKPTVLNPRFWREASAEDRSDEVQEWKNWLNQHQPVFSSFTPAN